MHRSGTSCMNGLLKLLGFDQGKMASIGTAEENPKGFFENDSVRTINNFLLKKAGCTWSDVPEEIVTADLPYAPAISILIKNEFTGERFSIKDPLISLLLDAYLESLKLIRVKCHVIRMRRPKDEVYASLDRRGNIYPPHFYDRYNSRLDYLIGKYRPSHIDVGFSNLLQDPLTILELVESNFNLPLQVEDKFDEILEFVER